MALPILDVEQPDDRRRLDALINRLRASSGGGAEVAGDVAEIIEQVKNLGDQALVQYMRRWTNPQYSDDMIRVAPEEMARARDQLDSSVRAALETAIENVRKYQQHVMPAEVLPLHSHGAELGMRFMPMRRVGLSVPGGKAAYPSTLIMSAVPAQVAGVNELAVACPPPTGVADADVSPLVLATASLVGIEEFYRIGGAQAMAALAFGTETIDAVDLIAGPGNAFVQQAKRQLFGTVGIDGFYGPSEVVVLADASADAAKVAADLLAQAEHDPGCCFLVSWDRAVIESVVEQIKAQLPARSRRNAIEPALADWSAAVLAADETTALKIVDEIAAEHVTLAVADPAATMARLRNGGAWFLGDATPVASGDYYAGPSHCLPTGTTARFTSGISVYTFLRRSSVEGYPGGMPSEAINHIAAIAEAEGLEAHAHSVRMRKVKD